MSADDNNSRVEYLIDTHVRKLVTLDEYWPIVRYLAPMVARYDEIWRTVHAAAPLDDGSVQ